VRMRLRGITVIYLHHDGKDQRTQRGHSKPEDPLNWVIGLRWEGAYRGQEGLKCILEFEKCRKPVYEYAKVAVELRDGVWFLGKSLESTKPTKGRPPIEPTDEQKEKFKALLVKGAGERTIAKDLGISRRLVRGWKKAMQAAPEQQQLPLNKGFDPTKESTDRILKEIAKENQENEYPVTVG
jgi:hypothetical protein